MGLAAPDDRASETGAARRERDALLDSASILLITRGLIALTVDAVAERAGVSAESVYRWWPSEEALAMDVLRREWVALAGETP
jgi:AcrR family transcriptional regulator